MDCMVTTALKSSLHKDMAFKSTQSLYFDDLWVAAGGGGGLNNVPSDDFSVDDLLDFSGKDFTDGGGEEENTSILEVASQPRSSNSSSSFSENDHFGSLLAAQLTVPADDLESLEWLSQFVDDSQSELSMLCAADGFNDKTGGSGKPRVEPVVQKRNGPCISQPQPVPRKPRSIRPKPQRKSWSVTTSLAIESSSFSSSSSYGSSTISPFVFANPVQDFELFSTVEKPPPSKKQKKKPVSETGSGSSGSQAVLRKCSHCQVQKTPQWRAGPHGPKTLCNACGVRFKSGRLFPEYRPALSPTFSLDVHSNSHRKVLEMRKKKEPAGPTDAGLGWSF